MELIVAGTYERLASGDAGSAPAPYLTNYKWRNYSFALPANFAALAPWAEPGMVLRLTCGLYDRTATCLYVQAATPTYWFM